jgi:hydrogenase maturation protease
MNRAVVDILAHALLYEGYILYPYRPSVKNRQRWTFGGLYPRGWSEAQNGSDAWLMQTQCLICGTETARLTVGVRFLHLVDRTVAKASGQERQFSPIDSLDIDGKEYQPWQEAIERNVELGEFGLGELLAEPIARAVDFPKKTDIETLRCRDGQLRGALIRTQEAIDGLVELSAIPLGDDLHQITIKITNRTPLPGASGSTRDQALMRSLVSTHTILGIESGEFVSLTDPPEKWKTQAAGCRNIGTWPVLVGQEPARDTILSSPIILSDYPELAPESPGDLFDSTEIDEILTLRIMTLTDDEKRAAAGVDDRVRQLLARTDALARDQLMSLHGTLRGLRPVPEEQTHG